MTKPGLRWSKLCATATGAVLASGATAAQASQTHTIKSGENLSTIARKYHVSISDIVHANHLTHQDSLALGTKLAIPDPPKRVVAQSTMRKAAQIHGDRISVRMGPGVSERRVDMFDMGAPITVTAARGDWYQVTLPDGRDGWVHKDYVKFNGGRAPAHVASAVARPHHHAAETVATHRSVKLAHVSSHVAKSAHSAHMRHTGRQHFASYRHASHRTKQANYPQVSSTDDVVRTAIAYRGTPYHYGGTSRGGFDCSGFTSYIYRQKGVSLPHNAAAQYSKGTKIAKSELKPGDLVFFHCGRRGISHVGIYAGNGKFVHASSPHSGGVRVDSLNDGYYKSTFRGARRIKK